MRDISTLTKEEVKEFLDAIDIGEFKLSKFKYDKANKVFEVGTITFWSSKDDNGDVEEIEHEDMWYFYQTYYETEFPEATRIFLYQEFLLAKGFKDNRFVN